MQVRNGQYDGATVKGVTVRLEGGRLGCEAEATGTISRVHYNHTYESHQMEMGYGVNVLDSGDCGDVLWVDLWVDIFCADADVLPSCRQCHRPAFGA